MRQQESLDIPAGESVRLEPTGLHIMLINLTRDLSEGDTFEVQLEFEEHGSMTVTSTVQTP
jgi:copper(I)-binding protein